jgi:hypothetical protein
MTPITAIGALLRPQLRSAWVTSNEKSAPATPMTLTIATDNFRGRHHVLMRVGKSDMCVPTVAARHLHKGVTTRARQTSEKDNTRVVFAAYH